MNTNTLPNLLDTLKSDGGFTYVPDTDVLNPASGYAIAVPGTERIIGNNLITREAFAQAFASVVTDLWQYAKPNETFGDFSVETAVGGWYSEDRGVYMIELTEVWHGMTRAQAVAVGATRDQEAIYDLSTGEEIKTGGRGDADPEG